MSVFRFGSVGPKFELKVFLERELHGRLNKTLFCLIGSVISVEWKGKWLIFHYSTSFLFLLAIIKLFKEETLIEIFFVWL